MLSKWLKRIGLAGLLVLGGARAHASAGIDAISYSVVPSLHSAAVNVVIQGDTDSNAVVRLFYTTPQRYQTLGASAFTTDTGMVCVRRPKRAAVASGTSTSGWMQHGLLLHMQPGTKYYYKVERTDATSGTTLVGSAAIESVTTLAVPVRPKSGPRIYVRKTGSDANSGLSPELAKLTINGALTALAAQTNAGASGGIEVGPGVYYERLRLNFGTDAAGVYRYITGQPGRRDSTIIDGSFEAGVNGMVLNDDSGIGGVGDPAPLAFSFTGQDSTYKAYFPSGDSLGSVTLGWGEYIHRKTGILEILNDAMGELSGWFWQNDTLYIKRKGGTTPGSQVLHAGYGGIADAGGNKDVPLLSVHKRNWHISGLTFRFNGTSNLTGGHAIAIGTTGGTSGAGTVIDSCRFYGNSGQAIYAPLWSGNARGDSIWVIRNTIDGLTIGRMSYQAAKSRLEENSNGIAVQGVRPIIWSNTISNVANGITTGTGSTTPGDTNIAYCGVVSNNVLRYISDDALELESAYNINLLAKDNNIRFTLSGISMAPVFSGPQFVLFNIVSQYAFQGAGRGIKLGATNGLGILKIWHNSIFSTSTGTGAHGIEYVSGGASDLQGLDCLNNLIFTKGTTGSYGLNFGSLTDSTNNALQYDRVVATSAAQFMRWRSTNRTIAVVRSMLGWEGDGVSGTNPAVADTAHYNYTPIGSGVNRRITGVNTYWMGRRYITGASPNAGALMYKWPNRSSSQAGRTSRAHLYKELE